MLTLGNESLGEFLLKLPLERPLCVTSYFQCLPPTWIALSGRSFLPMSLSLFRCLLATAPAVIGASRERRSLRAQDQRGVRQVGFQGLQSHQGRNQPGTPSRLEEGLLESCVRLDELLMFRFMMGVRLILVKIQELVQIITRYWGTKQIYQAGPTRSSSSRWHLPKEAHQFPPSAPRMVPGPLHRPRLVAIFPIL